jgi:flagellar biosynthesis GTPase FlhF
MSETCLIEPFGICVTQTSTVVAALLTALASLVTTALKIFFDRRKSSARQQFESAESDKRQQFEKEQRDSRQAFEKEEREARERFELEQADLQRVFENGQEAAAAERQARTKKELEDYIQMEKWKEQSWQRNLQRLEAAVEKLNRTSAGLKSLIDYGPLYDDLKMIQEAAGVLDIFGDFQTEVGHFALPAPMAALAKNLISHITKALLTLSPTQAVRQEPDRKAQLDALKIELIALVAQFNERCGDFERNPKAFLG